MLLKAKFSINNSIQFTYNPEKVPYLDNILNFDY